jgi:hypothetical protein
MIITPDKDKTTISVNTPTTEIAIAVNDPDLDLEGWADVFRTILYAMGYQDGSIREILPDEADLTKMCDDCEYKPKEED